MCGIAGFVDVRRPGRAGEMAACVRAMARTLVHRGPDDEGVWVDAEAGVGLGHQRLSILDLSPLGRQPMHSACGRYVVVFNGEIYNFRLLRAELEARGAVFRSQSDTEVMLEAFTVWGVEAALHRLNGMFALAVWDRQDRTLYLARDRLGEKPVYYGWMGEVFLFGSELKALRAHPAFRGDVDPDALALYLAYGYIPSPYSIYRGVAKLVPGALLRLRPGAHRAEPVVRSYWSARETAERGVRDPVSEPVDEAVEQLDTLLRDAVRLRMEADVPLGAFLSGGVDSSAVVALMQAQSARPVRTFTIGFSETAYDEAGYARAVANHLGTQHTELYVTPAEAAAVVPDLVRLYDEPFSDSSQIPTLLVARLARQHVKVALSGDGGDELFAGYPRYLWGRRIWERLRGVPPVARGTAAWVLRALARRNGLLRRVEPLLPGEIRGRDAAGQLRRLAQALAVDAPEDVYWALMSCWQDAECLVRGAVWKPTVVDDPSRWANLSDFVGRMMYIDTVMYLPDDILVKVDRASMGVSLEVRVPLLDHRIVEFAWRVPLALKLKEGEGKWLLRRLLRRYLPQGLIDRPKMGFGVPVGGWLRGALREWAEGLLEENRLRTDGFIAPEAVRTVWAEHLAGRRNWQYHLWSVLMLQAWLEERRREVAAPPPQPTAPIGVSSART